MADMLLVVDAQNDFIDGALGSEYALSIVPNIARKIRRFDGTVVFTRDTHDRGYLDTQEGKMLPVTHCVAGSHGWAINAQIAGARPGMCIDKRTFGMDKDQIAQMAQQQPSSIHIVGYVTDICVITNALALKTALPQTPIYVDAACCAGTSKAAHDAALTVMKSCQVVVEGA
ncbi:MAG: isochorismatase family cysteine hydrolase [Eubacteriales bacterium]|nr:isochorismatase family cysteine hydrolase [Christensenellaceae bacterium]MEA5066079.1 isochorismatase family cysteine hydrolase [Eubacteriales bacterium]